MASTDAAAMPPGSVLTVVKLGGSYAFAPQLRLWLGAIEARAGAVVLVPGGGPFADAVRAAQPTMGFCDAAAHDMALLAMAQYGRALVGLSPRLVLADSLAAIAGAVATARVPVWSPLPMVQGAADIPTSWEVTSDSLALVLATRLQAARVVLVKQRRAASDDVLAWAAEGLVDAAFPTFRRRFAGAVQVAGPGDTAALA